MEEEKRTHLQIIKQEFMKKLILNEYSKVTEWTQEQFQAKQLRLNPDGCFTLILLSVDRYADFCGKYTFHERGLFKYGISNIGEELMLPYFPVETFELDDRRLVMLINQDQEDTRKLQQVVHNIQSEVGKYLKLSISAGISTIGRQGECARLLQEAQLALDYRLIYGHQCIVLAEEIEQDQAQAYSFSASDEKVLIDALMLGRLDDIQEKYRRLIDRAKQASIDGLHLALAHLAFAIHAAVGTMETNSGQSLQHNFNLFIFELNQLETLADIENHFDQLFVQIVRKMEERKSSRHEDMAQEVLRIVGANFASLQLSIDSIADDLGMSPAYLGRLFKKMTGQSVTDYINEVRMNSAKQLLLTTDNPIDEIARRVGYANSPYFYKVFKKMHGITPNEFKKLNA
jgi:YesN/AraC family two-component response regulator